jgi:16S rRNA processing protein RimM
MPEEEKFKVGVIIGFHGLAGVMKVRPGTNNPALLLDLATVTVVTGANEELRCNVHSLRIEKGNLLLGVDEIADRTEAETFMGSEIFTDRSQLAALDENEFWTGDLVGLDVYTTGGVHVGTVCDIINGAGDLLEIRKAGPPILLSCPLSKPWCRSWISKAAA